MPRKSGTKINTPSVTPFAQGPSMIDAEGDSMTQDVDNALRTFPVGSGGYDLTSLQSVLDESLEELKKIRLANELILGQEV